MGVLKAPPVSMTNLLKDLDISERSRSGGLQEGAKLTFKISPVAGLEVCWDTTLRNSTLYMELSPGILPEGSKESLVTLLEYAEEKLKCNNVVICFRKTRSDRVSLLRVFNFFGFHMLPPGHELTKIGSSPDLLFMTYAIERDSDEESDSEDDDEDEGDGGKPRGRADVTVYRSFGQSRSSSESSTASDGSR